MRSLTPTVKQLNKLNLLITLSQRRANHTRSVRWPHHSQTPFSLAWSWRRYLDEAGSSLGVESTSLRVLSLTNLNANSKKAMNHLCEEDGLTRELGKTYIRCLRRPCFRLVWNWESPQVGALEPLGLLRLGLGFLKPGTTPS